MTLLVDTHALLWWLADVGELSQAQVQALERAESREEPIGIAAISLWESAKLVERGRLRLDQTVDVVLVEIEKHRGLDVLPLTARIALESTRLGPSVPSDPVDQLIVATARVHALQVVTADERIRRAGAVSVL